jgi:hypothetical protein
MMWHTMISLFFFSYFIHTLKFKGRAMLRTIFFFTSFYSSRVDVIFKIIIGFRIDYYYILIQL